MILKQWTCERIKTSVKFFILSKFCIFLLIIIKTLAFAYMKTPTAVMEKIFNRTILSVVAILCMPFLLKAQKPSWTEIQHSGKYYYGVGHGATMKEASEDALNQISSMIMTHIESDFKHLTDYTNTNGEIDNHHEHVQSYIKSCSHATLTNVGLYSDEGTPPNCVAKRYVARTEVERVFKGRIDKAKQFLMRADAHLADYKVDIALRDYYWAYMLIQSVQFPNEVKDNAGNVLVATIPEKIEEILNDINVYFEKKVGYEAYFIFTYKGHPIKTDFSYNTGKEKNGGHANNGRGIVEMSSSHSGNVYHLNIEYGYLSKARGDNDLRDLIDVVPLRIIPGAAKTIIAQEPDEVQPVVAQTEQDSAVVAQAEDAQKVMAMNNAVNAVNALQLKPQESQLAHDVEHYKKMMDKIVLAIRDKKYSDVATLDNFTTNGLEVFDELVMFGSAGIAGLPKIDFFKGFDSCVVARGLQMSFSFTEGRKQTLVEDVVFYFDKDGKIDNISFGLGIDTTNEVLNRKGSAWNDEVREVLLEFLENYKTAYSLKRLDYIKSIFADDAVIIVGKVVKKKNATLAAENNISIEGQGIIEYNKLTKNQYIDNLEKVFMRNEFIHLDFTELQMRKILKIKDADKFIIQLAQEYDSSRYSDKGYLMLFVDITNRNEPFIEVRTWQPDAVDIEEVYHEGNFY